MSARGPTLAGRATDRGGRVPRPPRFLLGDPHLAAIPAMAAMPAMPAMSAGGAAVLALVLAALTAAGAAADPITVMVDPGANRHPISPLIYGVNFGDDAQAARLRWPVRRWGGNATTRYSWQDDTAN